MRAELKRLHRVLRTPTVYVTHDQEEAMTLGDRIVVMKDGRVQQAGRPLDVYARPATRFVAGFVGTPPMNFIEGRVLDDGVFEGAGLRLHLRFPRSAGPAVLGVRPETIAERPPADANGHAAPIRVQVSVVEPLGDRMDVTLATPTRQALVGRLEARPGLAEGQEVTLYVDLRRAHLFEPGEGGRSVTA